MNPSDIPTNSYGPIVLFGSGETLPASGKAYEFVASKIENPLQIAILETPAGFQPNSKIVAQKVGYFIAKRLQNFDPTIQLIPARSLNDVNSPNNPDILKGMLSAKWIFMGPGSPTYTVSQLKDSLALDYLYAKHNMGAALTLSSAGVLALSSLTLPVYEIYKVGEDLHWTEGLNFFSRFGCDLVLVPHWDNKDGGAELDTSRCFMGIERFMKLIAMLPENSTILGIDEQTAMIILFENKPKIIVSGKGTVTTIINKVNRVFPQGEYDAQDLGIHITFPQHKDPKIEEIKTKIREYADNRTEKPEETIIHLANLRLDARKNRNWEKADELRVQIEEKGWMIKDTANGFTLNQKSPKN